MALNEMEEEVVFLKAVQEIIDSVVNHDMLLLYGTDPDSTVVFKTPTHQRFFNVVLVDFLSRTDKKAPVKQNSYLGALKAISARPSFSVNDSVASLRSATSAFADWLNQETAVDVWLPSIDTQAKIRISRFSFLKMCGDISKHNILRSVGVAEELQQTLKASGASIGLGEAMLAQADFYERFHTDILNYHSGTIAEFLNNIRWGIYEYLQPEFRRSFTRDAGDPVMYRFIYPEQVTDGFARQCYWDLMNEVRERPYIRRFIVTKSLKLRY
jgi:hypothetical protein